MSTIEFYTVASLERVYKDVRPQNILRSYSCLLNETIYFQMVLFSKENCTVRLHCQADLPIALYKQKYVKGSVAPNRADEYYETNRSFYPDPLCPFDGTLELSAGEYCSVWAKVNCVKAGKQEIICIAKTETETLEERINVLVSSTPLEKNDAILINWLHYDCICHKHGIAPFSAEFYDTLKEYIKLYTETGFNTLYVPLFTPPLDTAIGSERLTIQTVAVKKHKGKYIFEFSRLKEFIDFAKAQGIKYFEFSHLFTQWGAKACPKIIADVNGTKKRIFFWNDKSYGKKYRRFLSAFLRAFSGFIKSNNLEKQCFLHISDEPWWRYESNYFRLSKFMRKHTEKLTIMDAVSTNKFYAKKAQDLPIYSNLKENLMNEKQAFLFYYACDSKFNNLTNRFFYMPLQRTRMLGYQMSLKGALGFLHWGFNFYNAQYSTREIDPWEETDAGGNFPSGDSFIVYPKDNTVYPSIRLFTMQEAFSDYFALEMLKKRYGKEFVRTFLMEQGIEGLSIYPKSVEKHLEIRQKINEYLTD